MHRFTAAVFIAILLGPTAPGPALAAGKGGGGGAASRRAQPRTGHVTTPFAALVKAARKKDRAGLERLAARLGPARLEEALRSSDVAVVEAALAAIPLARGRVLLTSAVAARLEAPEPALVVAAARALGELLDGSAPSELDEWEVPPDAVARACGGLRAAAARLEASVAVRLAALDALASGQSVCTANAELATLLRDPVPSVRRSAALLLRPRERPVAAALRDMVIQKGHTYSIRFQMRATQGTRVYAKVGQSGPPYREYWNQQLELGPAPKTFKGAFTMRFEDDNGPELSFHLGGNMALNAVVPFAVCIDDVHIDDPEFTPKAGGQLLAMANVLVNQTGYFPRLEKIATVRSPSPVKWELQDASSAVVASGTTVAVGSDPASGDDVSIADFSRFTKPGSGYVLKAGGDASHPFDIGNELYSKLKYQALAYFYQNRSGIEIKMPFAGEPQWARPAGHVSEGKNRGDKKVPCAPNSGCTYSLDVTGGWYDAGDHGKYVVNAGISVWTLLDLWERTKHLGSSIADFGDGRLNIPEKGNGVPDLLDEVRWELEWELKMQVPQGERLAGMAHHKVHDRVWTALGLAPHEDAIDRFIYPPSTAATLNLAANAAQAARIWKSIDKPFADKCLVAAERAFKAAQANPALYAKPGGVGGGPYDDDNVTDELYWAAAELFITTKKPVYREVMAKSPHFLQVPAFSTASGADAGLPTPMTWGNVASLGSLSLAVVPGSLSAGEAAALRKALLTTADTYLDIANKQGYRVPFRPGPKGYPWGSNSFVLNNLIVMALAYDLSHQQKYIDGVAEGMDYIMGRNPMDQSYVTGYGERPLVNPHHRFWSYQANQEFPKAPAGLVSGGPNSGLEDPYVQAAGLKGCAPAKCFVDNIEAWSANEITINWNGPLCWVTSFLDERAPRATGESGGGAAKPEEKPAKGGKKSRRRK